MGDCQHDVVVARGAQQRRQPRSGAADHIGEALATGRFLDDPIAGPMFVARAVAAHDFVPAPAIPGPEVDFAQARVAQRFDRETGRKDRRCLLRAFQVTGKQEARWRFDPGRGQLLHRCEARRRQRRIGLSEAQAGRRVDIAVADENQFHGPFRNRRPWSLAFSGPSSGCWESRKTVAGSRRPATALPRIGEKSRWPS